MRQVVMDGAERVNVTQYRDHTGILASDAFCIAELCLSDTLAKELLHKLLQLYPQHLQSVPTDIPGHAPLNRRFSMVAVPLVPREVKNP